MSDGAPRKRKSDQDDIPGIPDRWGPGVVFGPYVNILNGSRVQGVTVCLIPIERLRYLTGYHVHANEMEPAVA